MILATNSGNSYIPSIMAPFLACIISVIDSAVCSSIDAMTVATKTVIKNVIKSSKATCSYINATAAATNDVAVLSLEYISSTLSSVSLKFVSCLQPASNLVSNPANFFKTIRFNTHS